MKRFIPTTCALALLTTLGSSTGWADRAHGGGRDDSEQLRYNHAQPFASESAPRLIVPQGFRQDGLNYGRDRYRNNTRFDGRDEPAIQLQRAYDPREDEAQQQLFDDRRTGPSSIQGAQRPVNDVIREVQKRYGGQVIGVQNSAGGSQYRVRVLQSDGRVRNVIVPAE